VTRRVALAPTLAALAGGAPKRRPSVRALADFSGHADCNLASLMFAAGVDPDRLLARTDYAAPFGQSPFAFSRGLAFERSLAEGGYGPILELLRERMGFGIRDARVANLRDGYPPTAPGMALRANDTRGRFAEMLRGRPEAPNLIDGAVFAAMVGGVRAHFEADAVAARARGPIHVGEIKSFPLVDERADPEKLGAALDQAAMYILLSKQLVADLGGDPDLVSTDAMLITPRNVGLRATLSVKNVERRVARAERLLARVPTIADMAALAPAGASLAAIADRTTEEARRLDALDGLADRVGTTYVPGCLSTCGLARFCRKRAFAAGLPQLAGGQAARLLPGVRSLDRAVELAEGAPPGPTEVPVAAQLARAARLYDRQVARAHRPAAGSGA